MAKEVVLKMFVDESLSDKELNSLIDNPKDLLDSNHILVASISVFNNSEKVKEKPMLKRISKVVRPYSNINNSDKLNDRLELV